MNDRLMSVKALLRSKQGRAMALIIGIGLLAALLILVSGGSSSEGEGDDGHGHGSHSEAAGHRDDEHHGAKAGDGHKDAEEHGDEEHHDEGAEDGEHAEGEVDLSEAQIEAAGITLATAEPATVRSALSLSGEIVFNRDRTAQVVPRVAGVVESVSADLGATVKRGQVLAVIASPELSERRSGLRAAQRRLALAQTTYSREKALWEDRISAEQDFLSARQALQEAEIAEANAQAQLRALGADAGSTGALNRFEIRAPFDGMVVEKDIALGETVTEDAKVFTVSDLSTVWAEVNVPAQALDTVRVGGQALVQATSLNSQASGTIAYVGSLVGQQTRAAQARITLPNPGGAWRPGLFVNVQVFADQVAVPVAVKPAAVHTVEDRTVVFVRTQDGFFARPVTTGRSDDQAVEIVDGLQAGARYALGNSFVIKSELGKGSAAHSH